MYPEFFGKLPSYMVMMLLGILLAVLLFRILATKKHIDVKVYNYYATAGIVSIAVGVFSAFFFQAIYNYAETGVFEFRGLTFMGGLVGGVLTFILFTLLQKNKVIKKSFFPVAEIAVCSITLAHAVGRVGCFLAGCCYGKESSFGLTFPHIGTVIPTQLYEFIFLFILTAVLIFLVLSDKLKGFNLCIYALSYSVFRFIIEFFRGDPRGAFLGIFSPSQVQSIILFSVGIVLLILRIKKQRLFIFEGAYEK